MLHLEYSSQNLVVLFMKFYQPPISPFEITTGYVTAATTKSVIVGTIILITSTFFVDLNIKHPFEMFCLLILICLTFSLFGFIIGIWANDFQRIQLIPHL